MLACWAQRDMVRRGRAFPADWVFLISLLYFPIYLVQSRRWRGLGLLLLIILGTAALDFLAWMAQPILYEWL